MHYRRSFYIGFGTREKGKLADIVGMPGDPMADITATERVSLVMKEGKIIKSVTKR